MGYWAKRILNLLTLGLKFKPWSQFYCVKCKKWVSQNHNKNRLVSEHPVHAFGWKRPKQVPAEIPRWSRIFKAVKLPDSVDLRKYAGPMLDQGNEGSCVGHGCAALKNYWENVQEDFPKGGLSRRCIYNGARERENRLDDEGAYVYDALDFLREFGTCTENEWPYHAGIDSDVASTQKISSDKAEPWKIKSYVSIASISEMQQALASGNAPVIGIDWFENWMFPDSKGRLPPNNGRLAGGHCVFLLGYLKIDGVWYFILQNSWGPTWNPVLKGFFYMRFSDMQKCIDDHGEFYTVVDVEPSGPQPNPPNPPQPEPDSKLCKTLKEAFNLTKPNTKLHSLLKSALKLAGCTI